MRITRWTRTESRESPAFGDPSIAYDTIQAEGIANRIFDFRPRGLHLAATSSRGIFATLRGVNLGHWTPGARKTGIRLTAVIRMVRLG